MSLTEKLNYLEDTKGLIKDAIVNKGVDVSDTDTFRSYADKIQSIEGGSAEPIVNMRLSNGVSDSEIVDGQKVIAVKTGEIPTEADTLTKITDFRRFFTNGSANYITALHFKDSYYDFIDTQATPYLGFKADSDGNFHATTFIDTSLKLDIYSCTIDTVLPMIYKLYQDYGFYSDGTYQDREGNFETITFDVEPEIPDSTSLGMIESYDGKYLFVTGMYYSSITTYPKVHVYSVEYDTKITATYIASCEVPILYGISKLCPSCNDYSIAVSPFDYATVPYLLQFDETTQTISVKHAFDEAGTKSAISILSKDWCVTSNMWGYSTLYHLNEDKTVKATFSDFPSLGTIRYYNPAGNLFCGVSQSSGGNIRYIRLISCPKDIAEPTFDDFGELDTTTFSYTGLSHFFLSETEMCIRWNGPAYQKYNYYTKEFTWAEFLKAGCIDYITDDGNIFCQWINDETYQAVAPVEGVYDSSVKESYSSSYTIYNVSGQPKYSVFLKDGTVESNSPSDDTPFISGLTITGPTSGNGDNYSVSAFEDVLYLENNGYPNFYLLADDLSYQKLTSGSQIRTDTFVFNGEYYGIQRDTGAVMKFILSGTSVTTEKVYTDSGLKTQEWVGSLGITKDFKYLLSLNNGVYFEITTEDGVTPKVLKKEIPSVISTNCPSGNVRLVQCFYDKHFGVLLKNGWYYLFKYTESLEDVELVEAVPKKLENQTTTTEYYSFLYTSHRNYWIIRDYANTAWTCIGKSQTNPVGVDWTAFRNTDTYYNKEIITGFLTGEKVSDDGQGNRVVKVRAVLE